MSYTQKQQLVCFPKVRVYKPWFRHFNDHKDFRNEGTVHLFSLMALFSYANFRSNERVINGDRYMEAPGQWICKLGALPRILRVHSKAQALELMEYFQDHGFLTFEILDEEKEILRFTISDWKEHCTHLQYNYYSYKGSGFFFFPLPVGRLLLKIARKEVGIVFSELGAIMDMWLHTILNDPKVRGSEYMPVVYYSNMRGMPLLSYTYLARRWGWSKSRVGRFMLKAGEYGIISRVSFSSSRGSVISMCRYGGTSLAHLACAIADIVRSPFPVRLNPAMMGTFETLAPHITADPFRTLTRDVRANADAIAAYCYQSPALFPFVTTTIAPTVIQGSSRACNVMPQDMQPVVNFRLADGDTAESVMEHCRAAVQDPTVELRYQQANDPSTTARRDGYGYRTVVDSMQRYYPDVVFVPSMTVGANDAHQYEQICDTCLRCSPFMAEPEEAASGVHGMNERILVRAYLQGIRVLIDLMEHANL